MSKDIDPPTVRSAAVQAGLDALDASKVKHPKNCKCSADECGGTATASELSTPRDRRRRNR